jgi:RNA polymerase primary sigma factor
MASYHYTCIAELTHQLKLSPTRLRLKQLEAAEYLIDLLESDGAYPYDFVCHQITAYRPKSTAPGKPMIGKGLIEDLVQLVEDLSGANPVPVALLTIPCWTAEELAGRLKVSTKTICRWRRRGLAGRKLRYPDNTIRMSFPERCIRRFVTRHSELVRRGAAFKQLTSAEKTQIISLAREALAERRLRLHELSQLISARMGRAVETVRYTLRRYDQTHPEEALFGSDDHPVVRPELQEIYRQARAGRSIDELAVAYQRSTQAIREIVHEVRARLLKAQPIHYVYNPEFDSPLAEATILAAPPAEDGEGKRIRPPRDLPPYLQDLYHNPLLTAEHERYLFRKYNYLKFKANQQRSAIDVLDAADATLDSLESLLAAAEDVKNEILRANLRLVVSIARRHVGRSSCFFEIVSDGNLSLMRAAEKFDYARGFKFSTYASWAIMRNYARTIPEQLYQSARLVTGAEETLAAVPDRSETGFNAVLDAAQQTVQKGLGLLNPRERDIIVWHYGLQKNGSPMTLDQIGKVFGLTKERIRQIERKAFSKLRDALAGGDPASLTA